MKKLFAVFAAFFKIGAFTFGGGYAMIPLIQQEAVHRSHWVSDEEILEIVAIAEATPGPIAVNCATFVGYRAGGFWGAVCATLGVVLPSFLTIYAISFVLREFQENVYVHYAFRGIRAGVLALICRALWGMFRKAGKGALSYAIMAGAFLLVAVLDVPVILVLVGCALTGLAGAYYAGRHGA